MAIHCPQCGTAMSELSVTQAQCAKHGPYQILFQRSAIDDGTIPLATMPPPAMPAALPYARQYMPYAQAAAALRSLGPCQNHQQVAAAERCFKCSARICS